MNKLKPVLTLLLLAAGTALATPPNVILLITDDQGYGELSCHGNPVLRTPHMDQLHDEGVRLTDYHTAPMCTPTRGQLMTGLDAARNGAINVSSGRTLIRPEIPTIADMFSEADYATGLFGKWHLGDNYPFRPQDSGFQEVVSFPSSHINSVPDVWNNDYFDDVYLHNGKPQQYKGYCTDVFFNEAMKWMKSCSTEKKPFFLYLPTNAPHQPHWVPEKYRKRIEKVFTKERFPNLRPDLFEHIIPYLAMIENVDDNLGRLEDFLDENGLTENTILLFSTDNGSTFGKFYFPAGMRGRKTDLWEGGHRVPLFVRWPAGGLVGGRDVDGITQTQDLVPTLLELCGIDTSASFDGISLVPALKGEEPVPEDRMVIINYSRMPSGFDYPSVDSPSKMSREGAGVLWKRWRLLADKALYNLDDDPLQQKNVIGDFPEVAEAMREKLNIWWDGVKDIANVPQHVIIGSEHENPSLLTACEWLDVFVDQQYQVRLGERKNGWWELDVAEEGNYEFELRRWPRDSGLALSDPAPADKVTDGVLEPGVAYPITRARININGIRKAKDVKPGDKAARFTVHLKPGPVRLHTWFDDDRRQPIFGAYYVYVNKK